MRGRKKERLRDGGHCGQTAGVVVSLPAVPTTRSGTSAYDPLRKRSPPAKVREGLAAISVAGALFTFFLAMEPLAQHQSELPGRAACV